MVSNELSTAINLRVQQLAEQLNAEYGPDVKIELQHYIRPAFVVTRNNLAKNILEACCYAADCTVADFTSNLRNRNIVMARFVFYKVMRENEKSISLSELGRITKKDHATVLYALKAIDTMLQVNDKLAVKMYNDVLNLIKPVSNAYTAAQIQA